MLELGQLERRHEEFSRRNVRIVAVSVEDFDEAQQTQEQFPHLLVLADRDRNLAKAVDVIHPGSGPGGADTAAPTTILVDRQGEVRWIFRPSSATSRLSPDDLLAEIARAGGFSR
jgi:peroxiredoxin